LVGQPRKERGHIMRVKPIQRASRTVIVEHISRASLSSPVLNRFVLTNLRQQIELAVGETQPMQNPRHHCGPDTHIPATFPDRLVEPCCSPSFLADSYHYSYVIQALGLIRCFLRHALALPRFFLPYSNSFFPSILLRYVGGYGINNRPGVMTNNLRRIAWTLGGKSSVAKGRGPQKELSRHREMVGILQSSRLSPTFAPAISI
jgi:hypothetical protein